MLNIYQHNMVTILLIFLGWVYFLLGKKSLKLKKGFLLLVILFIFWSLFIFLKALAVRLEVPLKPGDFGSYYAASKELRQGVNFYYDYGAYDQEDRFIKPVDSLKLRRERLENLLKAEGIPVIPEFTYPPTWYVMFLPFTLVSWSTAYNIFSLANLLALILCGWLLYKMFYNNEMSAGLLIITGLGISFLPLQISVLEGQVNPFVLLMLGAAMKFYADADNDRIIKQNNFSFLNFTSRNILYFLSGGLIALATAIKVFPGLFFAYFLWKKRFSVAFGFFFFGILILLFSILIGGFEIHWVYAFKVIPKWLSNLRAYDMNISVCGFFCRLLVGGEGIQSWWFNPNLARFLSTLLSLSILLISFWRMRNSNLYQNASSCITDNNSQIQWLDLLDFSILLTICQMISSWVLVHHLIFLLPALLTALIVILRSNSVARKWKWLIWLSISYLLISLEGQFYLPQYRQGLGVLLISSRTYGTLILWIILIQLRGKAKHFGLQIS